MYSTCSFFLAGLDREGYVYERRDVKVPRQLKIGMNTRLSLGANGDETAWFEVAAILKDGDEKICSVLFELPGNMSSDSDSAVHALKLALEDFRYLSWEKGRYPGNFPIK